MDTVKIGSSIDLNSKAILIITSHGQMFLFNTPFFLFLGLGFIFIGGLFIYLYLPKY